MTTKEEKKENKSVTRDEMRDHKIKDVQRFELLTDIIEQTWGVSSTTRSASYSVTLKVLADNILDVKYAAVRNFASSETNVIRAQLKDEGIRIVQSRLDEIKEQYKDLAESHGIDKKKISFKLEDSQDSLEYTNGAFLNPKRTCVFKLHCTVKIS